MKQTVRIAPSILSADFSKLGEEVAAIEAAGADWVHIDVMDGHFVPNLTFGAPVVSCLRKVTKMPFDVHLMVEAPQNYIADFAKAGADILTIHLETAPHLHRVIQEIKEAGLKAAVSLNPSTPLCLLEEILPDLDMVLLMSVNPGFGGQAFIPSSLEKVRKLRQMLDAKGLKTDIQVDGGVTPDNAAQLIAAGATVLVAGSAVYKAPDMANAIHSLRGA
ncbi:ribulose-phosphate 3-epimerase [uncultured Anaeromusa sp.]|uniref:ribulose-phosphate 3-epimerase n=1 Tax=uncultured Anaeromusa sp. TaxID=673273 RepID=UPI0029C74288|nr:ribulose-phosphate 3-epimerase [uncultured Anaeromusa sp.]